VQDTATLVEPLLAAEWFAHVGARFDHAQAAHPQAFCERYYLAAGRPIVIRCVGRRFADHLHRAFAHLAIAPVAAPALTIELWDEGETGISYPLATYPIEPGLTHNSEGEVLRADTTSRFFWSEKEGAVTWLDRKTSRIRGWRANGNPPPTHERSKPMTFLLSLWLYDRDIHVLHAGMTARGERGVLIAGGSGIGKTTTALSCLIGGFDYLSDDQIAVEQVSSESTGGAPVPTDTVIAHSLFHSARLEPAHLANFPALQPHAIPSTDAFHQKFLVLLAELFPERIRRRAVICALVLPRVGSSAETRFRQARRVEAFTYMARTSLLTPLGAGRRRFERVNQLLARVPCYWLELGHDLTTIPAALDRILSESVPPAGQGAE